MIKPNIPRCLALLSILSATSCPAHIHAALTDQLEVYLNFDGDLQPALGTTVAGVPIPSSRQPRFTDGPFGEAATFLNDNESNGIGDRVVSLGRLDALYRDSFSVSFWFKTGMRASGGGLTGNARMWDERGWPLATDRLRQVSVGLGQNEHVGVIPGLTDGRWHHLALTVDREARQISVHFDGGPVFVSVLTPGVPTTGLDTLIGASGDGAWGANAVIDDYAIWRRALTAEEIAMVHGAGLRGRSLAEAENPGLIFVHTNPRPNAVGAAPDSAITTTIKRGNDPIDLDSTSMVVNGIAVEPTMNVDDDKITVVHQPAEPMRPGSSSSVRVTVNGGTGSAEQFTHEWTYQVSRYARLSKNHAVENADGLERGFHVRTVWASTANASLAFTLERAHAQLNGTLLNPATNEPFPNDARLGPNPDGSWTETGVINYNDRGSGAGGFPVDVAFPGLVGVNNPDNFTLSVTGALPLKAGFHRFGVNADDGFEVRFGAPPQDRFLSETAAA